ncbi:baseplate J/gp47 family protein [Kaistia dalseonensis]|uniref:Phage protein gp47/JayE n=1 Tax=Kaistia dalseonensis TaxID=410840 RepID=A0ABU0HCD6_9HYPH|nr:baseplate J/gp47 family protein [Kaistia dalseonensis]MCX5497334.1 baseplate J/gp47 family protein [Kaistia dalseonensis]MDQ0439971.1 putative phage protein gp47/JayE [Kaistia dalseonensis]
MPFPISSPQALTRRLESLMEAELRRARPDAAPAAIARAVRSPRGVISALIRVTALAVYEVHLHLRWWGDQYFPDTAEAEFLARHASIWGVVRRPATRAIGYAWVQGAVGTIIPAGALLIGLGATFTVTEAVTIEESDEEGWARLSVEAVDTGIAGNTAADTPLTLSAPIVGLVEPVAYVDESGLTGGAVVETDASLLARLLEIIREPAHGGAFFDYPVWIKNKFAATQVAALGNWVGPGSVGVVVAMGTALLPRVPTEAEITAMATYLDEVRPVTAEVIVLPVILVEQPLTILLDPFEVSVKTAVQAAVSTIFAAEAKIGTRLPKSRLSEAISAATGEYRHELTIPAGDILPGARELPIPGAITWVAPE